jgi:DNA-binding transcriptional LysR family regulator
MLIDHINLTRIDLNLLVALDALLTDRSVTRAAARVGLRQSAMSHNLARLRALLGDELLTRGPEGMRPTPRALALVDPVRITLAQITALVSPNQTFDARTAERAFRIGMPDGAEVLLGPALLSYLRERAPATLGLSISPAPVELPEAVASLVWHASYDHDPANRWLRQTVESIAATAGWRRK